MKLGIDLFNEKMFEGKKVGLITNPTGFNSQNLSTIEVLKDHLVALFSPEHGIRGDLQAGLHVSDYLDPYTNIMVYSLYGDKRRPRDEIMNEIDIIAIDIQDVGSRFYTYISTMAYCMQACKEFNKKFVIFDRPNPINANSVSGNILDLEYRSFIGYYPIVQRHGMTIGELANLFNNEYQINCELEIIKMEDYSRTAYYDELGLFYVSPSPNLPTLNSCLCYNATCIFEGTNISEGRGTALPFEVVGACFINPYELSDKLNKMNCRGVYFRPLYFKPIFSKFKDEVCGGVQLHISNRDEFEPVRVGYILLDVIRKSYPDEFKVNKPYKVGGKRMLELNTGCSYIANNEYDLEKQIEILEKETEEFKQVRSKYLLY